MQRFLLVCCFVGACAAPRGTGTPTGDGGTSDGATDFDGETPPDSAEDARELETSVPGDSAREAGPRICTPGEQSCEGTTARVCRSDGRAFDTFECDPLQGMACDANVCRGPCSRQSLGTSYIGCDYYPTVTINSVFEGFHFAVAVANAYGEPAGVTITRGDTVISSTTVAPGDVGVITLPWVLELKGPPERRVGGALPGDNEPVPTRLVADGAYRLRTTRPVTVYQYNPLEYSLPEPQPDCPQSTHDRFCGSYTNDSSILFPVNALGTEYVAVAWHGTWRGSFVAITATEDDTEVTVAGRRGWVVRVGGGVDAAGNGTVAMNAGDVLQVVGDVPSSSGSGLMGIFGGATFGTDLTGLRVTATKRISVIGGNGCANIPTVNIGFCDHVEESALPLGALGDEYVASYFASPGPTSVGRYVLRLNAVVFPTTVTFAPPIRNQDGVMVSTTTLTEARPQFDAWNIETDTVVNGDHPFIATQFQQGTQSLTPGGGGEERGDPAQGTLPPTRQFRDEYIFFASTTYDANWANVIAPTGATVRIDDIPINASAFEPVGASGYSVARYQLGNLDEGQHTASSDRPFGLLVYGYGRYTSYLYPGGLDLTQRPF